MSKVIDRVGEVRYNNKGYKMEIVACRGTNDIDVKFEDDTYVYGATYYSFNHGRLRKPFNKDSYKGKIYNSWEVINVYGSGDYSATARCLSCKAVYNDLRLFDILNNKSKMCNSCSRSKTQHRRWNTEFKERIGLVLNGYKIIEKIDNRWLVECIDCKERYEVENCKLVDKYKMFKCKCKVGINYDGKYFYTAKDLHKYLVDIYKENAIAYKVVCDLVDSGDLEKITSMCNSKVDFGHSCTINRLNETRVMKNGQSATIIKQINSHDLFIKFEDDIVVHGQYRNFKRGTLENPNLILRNSKKSKDVLLRGAKVKSFKVNKFAYRLSNPKDVFYNCECIKCGLKDILTPREMLEHKCNN